MNSHVEIIQPRERLAPSLGGTGYLPPAKPATAAEIAHELDRVAKEFPDLPSAVFKVARQSVSWDDHNESRRLSFRGNYIACKLIGGTREWWFVSLKVSQANKLRSL